MHDIDDHDAPTTIPGLLVFRYDAPLFFLNAYDFFYKVSLRTGYRVVILNMEANVELDTTALNILKELHDRLAAHDIDLAGLGQERRPHPDEESRGGSGDR